MVYRHLLIAQTWTLPEWRAEPSPKGYSSIDIKGCWSWLRGVYTDEDSDVVGGEKGRDAIFSLGAECPPRPLHSTLSRLYSYGATYEWVGLCRPRPDRCPGVALYGDT